MATPTCNYQYPAPAHNPCPEPAWDDAGRCFFHSGRPDKDAAEMVRQVKEKLRRGDNNCTGYVFPAEVNFGGIDFGDGAFFFDTTFGERASFKGATFGDGASFWRATFGQWADFFDTTFGERASFSGTRFGKGAFFFGARFGERAIFSGAHFGDWVNFVVATFGQGADFGRATFGDGAFFFDTTFGERASFEGTTFGDGVSFRIASPSVRFILARVTFQGRAYFSGESQDLRHFEFHHVRLPRAVFRDAIGLDRAEFDDVRWGILGDEVDARQSGQPKDFDAAERVYREIRRSYLERRDFTMARQMHWGEMEMRRLGEVARREAHKRLGRLPLWPHLSLTTLYWMVSGYGQRWLNALVALALLWLVCGVAFAMLGVEVGNSISNALGDGLLQSALSLVLHPADYAQPATAWGWLVEFLELVLSPIIITTLVLAVREQFRH